MVHTSENEYRMLHQPYPLPQSRNLRSNRHRLPVLIRSRRGGMLFPPDHDPDHAVSRKAAASPHFSNSSCPGILIQETFW